MVDRDAEGDATEGDPGGVPTGVPGLHEVFVVRHGATEWSRNGRHTGTTDLPLLPEGEAEAGKVSALLDGHRFALVLVSPLSRARRTCELAGLADHALSLIHI